MQQHTLAFSVDLPIYYPSADLALQLLNLWLAVGVFFWVWIFFRALVVPDQFGLLIKRRGATLLCVYIWAAAPLLVLALVVKSALAPPMRASGQGCPSGSSRSDPATAAPAPAPRGGA